MFKAPAPKRDVTRALEIVAWLTRDQAHNQTVTAALLELAGILQVIDARTGRRDPTKRKGRT